MPIGSRGNRTRQRLLDAGRSTIAAKGVHGTRVDDIVAAADSSHGTFYLYFSSKEDLVDALVAEVAADLQPLADSVPRITNSAKGRAALREWLSGFVDAYARHHDVIKIWTEDERSGGALGIRADETLNGLVVGLLRNLRIPARAGLDPTVASLALVAMIERLNYYVVAYDLPYSRDEVVATCADVVEAAVFG